MSHFSALGVRVATEAEQVELADYLYTRGEGQRSRGGWYYSLGDGDGVELWLELRGEKSFVAIHPHLSGPTRRRVGLGAAVDRDGVAGFSGWANPEPGRPEAGSSPILFNVPDFRLLPAWSLPAEAVVQLAAFGETLEFFDDDDAYLAAQAERELKWGRQSFAALGTFAAETEPGRSPASALLGGSVREWQLRKNQLTRNEYLWARVETLGGELDVVADPKEVARSPVAGGIVFGRFWLSGRFPPG